MGEKPDPYEPESDEKIIAGMGRERMALRAKKTTVVLLRVASFLCLSIVLASVARYIPYALGPVIVLTVTAIVGLFSPSSRLGILDSQDILKKRY